MNFNWAISPNNKEWIIPTVRRKLAVSAPLALDSSAPWRMERSCSVMSQQVWRWTLPILWLRPHAATTPSAQSRAPPDWVCACMARVDIVGCSRDSPSDYNSRWRRAEPRQGQTTRDQPPCLLAVLMPLPRSGSSAGWSLTHNLSTHRDFPNCTLVKWLSINPRHEFGLSA